MKKLIIAIALTSAMALTSVAGDAKKEKKNDAASQERKALHKQMLEKYDTNKDGTLDKDEKAKISKEDKERLKNAMAERKKNAEKKDDKK